MANRNILLITPVYFAKDIHINATPVINFFAREWKELGYEVHVIHLHALFPMLMRALTKPFVKAMESKLGVTISCETVRDKEYFDNDVPVYRIAMKKIKPHGRYCNREIKKATSKILSYCNKSGFKPDVIISHWVNPCVEVMRELKKEYLVPIVDVLHSGGKELMSLYGSKYKDYMNAVDIWGYRSRSIREKFEKDYGVQSHWVYAYSGIPYKYVENKYRKYFFQDRYIYVGNFRPRKHSDTIVDALAIAYNKEDQFEMNYIGSGAGDSLIVNKARNHGISNNVHLLGFLSRDTVKQYMSASDVFIMISEKEVFGLVYLEAMSAGTIPIASKNEGFDGIIENGVNGFLCQAGNDRELAEIIKKIRTMNADELQEISTNAQLTAKRMTDKETAKQYIEDVFNQIECIKSASGLHERKV